MACNDPMIVRQNGRQLLLKRRRAQRGAALVETAFMLPMFVILWYGSLYVHNLGKNYIKVNTSARADAWQTAMANCGAHAKGTDTEHLPASLGGVGPVYGGGGSDIGSIKTALQNSNPGGAIGAFVSSFTTALANAFPAMQGSTFLKTSTVSWREPDLYDHSETGSSVKVKGTTSVVCDLAPEDGTIANVAGALVSIIASMVHS
jgi:hypothetical protein